MRMLIIVLFLVLNAGCNSSVETTTINGHKMDAEKISDLQNGIVVDTANAIDGSWDAAVVNIEIDSLDDEQTENCLALSFSLQDGKWKRSSFQLPYSCYDLFVTLRDSTPGPRWKSCTLEFNSQGLYRFIYSYAPPKRLNGIHDSDGMLEWYLPTPLQ